MQRVSGCLCLFIASILLTACDVQHHYAYTPPTSAADRVCVARCSSGKTQCEKICTLKYNNCMKRGGVFCKPVCPCVVSFNTCYSACGGQVQTIL